MTHRRRSSGALESNITLTEICPPCGHTKKLYVTIRKALELITNDQICACGGKLAYRNVDR